MARSDLLLKLVKAGIQGDKVLFHRTVEAVIAEESAKHHHVLAERLSDQLRNYSGNGIGNGNSNGSLFSSAPTYTNDQIQSLLYEISPRRTLDKLILPSEVTNACQELVEEHQRAELLRSYGLEPRNRILLSGPPGNGKTSLAEAIAEALMVPFFVVRYEGVIGSYLGETALRLRKLFDHVRARQCVLFLDEFDTIGKERGDVHETGEIKRVVSSLLLQIDNLPSYVVVITATNHPELLDRAVWRRFQLRYHLPNPEKEQIIEWFKRFEFQAGESLRHNKEELAEQLANLSFAEIEDFGSDILRRRVLSMPHNDIKYIVNQCLHSREAQRKLVPYV